ncbi:hypothetical protein ACFFHH_16870 [Cytobacillus solani]|uniref:Uncharacterized protein n=1 Tax=Cytobacillus solani TaxID=1637975 RepID=A0A0Q3QV88_9BACI|nr:hypothetical protein [Cytobacillus solani]KOP71617.1 hypothetical protein AMS60_20060 [Bacillus sp. FJAT-21945]KQL21710.1 hypothetical protein AN957_26250 [Cytobacillus solani]USK55028.1 hypothetical protein LIS82_26440 [Cytobacillus solani]
MKSSSSKEIKRGQAISFRIPSDTPDHLLGHLQRLKELERRNFSSKIAEFVLQGVGQSFSKERETITVPLPHKLSKSQRDWLKHEHSEAVLGSIVYQLLTDPIRTTALLASLNSNSLDINDALYLQEELPNEEVPDTEASLASNYLSAFEEKADAGDLSIMDDLNTFDWQKATKDKSITAEEQQADMENDLDSLLGDFLNKMNK